MPTVVAPISGRVVGLAGVPDPVFAQAMVGPGTAIDPVREPGTAVAPMAGRLVKLHPHAFVIQGAAGHGILVHLGIDTVQLKGEGFELLAAEGDQVASGSPVIRWDPAAVEAGGRSAVCPVIALDVAGEALSWANATVSGTVQQGDELFQWT
jgi:PTS system N-acetylglucosamine-specific IIA component